MDHMESEETSNDTTMISELLKSAEVMQQSGQQLVAVPSSTSTEKEDKQQGIMQMQQQQIVNSTDQHMEIPPLTAIGGLSSAANIIMLNQGGYSNADDSNKLHHQMRHVHIPYILNGELYQIQTQDGENVTVKCCHCPPDRVYRGSVRSTGNFHMHIKRRHPDLLEKLHDMKVNALLERRDRLMRNRKISSRSNRSRLNSSSIIASTPVNTLSCSGVGVYKEESKLNMGPSADSSLSVTSPPELSLLHTHKLKIKTVFQRHQMQQREAAEMRNWNNSDYVVMPIAKLTSSADTDAPINYSLKSQEKIETHSASLSPHIQQHSKQQLHQQHKTDIPLTTTNDCTNVSAQQQQKPIAFGNNEYIYEHQQQHNNNRELSTTTTSQSSISPSVMSNFSSVNNNHEYNMETTAAYQQHNIHPLHQQQTLSIIKPEDLLIPTEQQAIDLTLHTDSGIFSHSNGSLNNISQNATKEKRAGSQQTLTTPHATGDSSSTQRWQELLMHVETSLRDIQHEMNIRNQIESNRMFLDIAKFKFLHPGFQFNW